MPPPYHPGMDVSPQHLREVEFREKWRGYSPDEVDELLERAATTVADLQARLESAEERATNAERRVLETSDDDVRRALVLAQRTADAAVAEAAEEAERRLADAEERARSVQAEADERVALELEELGRRRTALEAEVAALATFVERQRERITAEVREQLAWLEAPGRLALPEPPPSEVALPAPPQGASGAVAASLPVGSNGSSGPDDAAAGDGGPPTEALSLDDLAGGTGEVDVRDPVPTDEHGTDADEPPALGLRLRSTRPALDSAAVDDPFFSELRQAVADDPVDPRDALEGPDLVDVDAGRGRPRRRSRRR